MDYISADKITKTFNGKKNGKRTRAIAGLSLAVKENEFVGRLAKPRVNMGSGKLEFTAIPLFEASYFELSIFILGLAARARLTKESRELSNV